MQILGEKDQMTSMSAGIRPDKKTLAPSLNHATVSVSGGE